MPFDQKEVWDKAREAGAVIYDSDGNNVTADADTGFAAFVGALGNVCPHMDDRQELLRAIWDVAEQASAMAYENSLPTTNPKCFSKPIMKLTGCDLGFVQWTARSGKEVNCYGPPEPKKSSG